LFSFAFSTSHWKRINEFLGTRVVRTAYSRSRIDLPLFTTSASAARAGLLCTCRRGSWSWWFGFVGSWRRRGGKKANERAMASVTADVRSGQGRGSGRYGFGAVCFAFFSPQLLGRETRESHFDFFSLLLGATCSHRLNLYLESWFSKTCRESRLSQPHPADAWPVKVKPNRLVSCPASLLLYLHHLASHQLFIFLSFELNFFEKVVKKIQFHPPINYIIYLNMLNILF
jgi:hypothetical protein